MNVDAHVISDTIRGMKIQSNQISFQGVQPYFGWTTWESHSFYDGGLWRG